jgi:DNA-directed RNA polymerase specialized sigma24 family protein
MKSNEPAHQSNNEVTTLTALLADGGNATGLTAHEVLSKYDPYLKKLARSQADADDIRQNLSIKFFMRYDNTPEVWEQVKNKNSYMFRTIQNAVNDFYGGLSNKFEHLSYDDRRKDGVRAEIDNISDNWEAAKTIQDEADLKDFEAQILAQMSDFSDYCKELIQLSFFEGVKPRMIAKMMMPRYPDKNEPEIISDCNAVKAKFRARIKNLRKKLR